MQCDFVSLKTQSLLLKQLSALYIPLNLALRVMHFLTAVGQNFQVMRAIFDNINSLCFFLLYLKILRLITE
jgi:hypothetical protein